MPFERRGSGGGLAEDMRGAESGLLALQGGLDAEEGSDSDVEELGDSSSVSSGKTVELVASCDKAPSAPAEVLLDAGVRPLSAWCGRV